MYFFSWDHIYFHGRNFNEQSFILCCYCIHFLAFKKRNNCLPFWTNWCFWSVFTKVHLMLIVSCLSLFSDGWFQVVHPAPGNANGTLVNGILHHCSLPTAAFPNSDIFSETEYSSDAEFDSFSADQDSAEEISSNVCNDSVRPGIVHRLDKGTSGLLVVAKVIPIFVKNAWEHEIDNQFLYSIIVEIQYTMFQIPAMVIYDYMSTCTTYSMFYG